MRRKLTSDVSEAEWRWSLAGAKNDLEAGKTRKMNENVCRFCLKTNLDELLNLSEIDKEILNITEKFFQVPIFDAFLQFVCFSCLQTLESFERFSKMCKESFAKLLSRQINNAKTGEKTTYETQNQEIWDTDTLGEDLSDYDTRNAEENNSKVTNDTKKHMCEYCPKSFKTKLSKKVHVRSHTNERPFVCTECGKSFKTYSAINNHRAAHSKDKKFQCVECNYRTTTNANLKIHGRTHSQERY